MKKGKHEPIIKSWAQESIRILPILLGKEEISSSEGKRQENFLIYLVIEYKLPRLLEQSDFPQEY